MQVKVNFIEVSITSRTKTYFSFNFIKKQFHNQNKNYMVIFCSDCGISFFFNKIIKWKISFVPHYLKCSEMIKDWKDKFILLFESVTKLANLNFILLKIFNCKQ